MSTYADILDRFETVSETYRDICFPEGFFAVNVKAYLGWGACYFKGKRGQEDAPLVGHSFPESGMFTNKGQRVTSTMDIFKEEN